MGTSLLILIDLTLTIILPTLLLKRSWKTYTSTLDLPIWKYCSNYIYSIVLALTKSKAVELRWNTSGITVASPLNGPYGFKLNQFDTLYIVEFGKNRVQKWMRGATTGTIIVGPSNGSPGAGSNQFNFSIDVFVEENEDMYITDRNNNRLQFWPSGSLTGITVAGRI